MTLDILENSESIKLAHEHLFNSLFKNSINSGKFKVNYEYYNGLELKNFIEESDIYCLKEKKFWFTHIQMNNRILYAFGVDVPKENDLNNPILVIDFSIKGMNKNTLTVFAIDNDSDLYVLLRVNYNKLRDSLKNLWVLSERIQAVEEDKKRYFINFGQLNQSNFLENFTNIIDEIRNVKSSRQVSSDKLSTNRSESLSKKSCVLCSETFSEIELIYDTNLNKLIEENPL